MNETEVRFMRKSFYHIVFFIIIANQFLFAQLQEGGLPDEFLRWGIGGRALGMGRAYTALADDATAAYWNPAGLADDVSLYFPKPGFFNRLNLSTFYSCLLADTKFFTFGMSYQAFQKHTFGLTYLILSTSDVQGWSSYSTYIQRLGTYNFNKQALLLSWAYRIDSWPTLDIGITTKYIWNWNSYSNDPTISAYGGLDLGLRYRCGCLPVYFGINFQNFDDFILGKLHNLPVGGDRYRWAIRSGIGYKLYSSSTLKLIGSLDHEAMASYSFAWSHFRGGMELRTYQDLFLVRCGFNRNEFSLGIGFSLKKLWQPLLVDYAWGDFNPDNLPGLSRGSVTWKGATLNDAKCLRMLIKLLKNDNHDNHDRNILFFHKVIEESYDRVLVELARAQLNIINDNNNNENYNNDELYKKVHKIIAELYESDEVYKILVRQFPDSEVTLLYHFSLGWHLKQLNKKVTIKDFIDDYQNKNKAEYADDQLSSESAFANPNLGTNLLFYSGECFLESGDTTSAKIEFAKIKLFYPDIFFSRFEITRNELLRRIKNEHIKQQYDASKLSFPQDFIKESGGLYIVDSGNKRIIDLKKMGDPILKENELNDPLSLLRFPCGINYLIKQKTSFVFITDLRANNIIKSNITTKDKCENLIINNSIDQPFDIISYTDGLKTYLLIVESGKNQIKKFKLSDDLNNAEEEVTKTISESLYCPTKIAYDSSEKALYVADWGHRRIVKFSEEGGKFKYRKLEKSQYDNLGFPIKLKIRELKNNQNTEKYLYVLYTDLYGQKATNLVKYFIRDDSLRSSPPITLPPQTISFDFKSGNEELIILKSGPEGKLETIPYTQKKCFISK